jgi:CPA2 family monovalent cation:H+ antiporter-2
MVRTIRKIRPSGAILARAKDAEHAMTLEQAGASYVVPDAIEAGLQMAGRALEDFGIDSDAVRSRLAIERKEAYQNAATN